MSYVMFSEEVFSEILEHIATSSIGLEAILNRDGYPTRRGFWHWIRRSPENQLAYEKARAQQAEIYADEVVTIGDDLLNLVKPTSVDVEIAKVRIQSRERMMGVMNRKRFGQKVALTGGDATDAPIQLEASNRERAKAVALIIAQARGSLPAPHEPVDDDEKWP